MPRKAKNSCVAFAIAFPIALVASIASPADASVVPIANFGTIGIATNDFHGLEDSGNAIAVQSDNKVVVGGHSFITTNSEEGIVVRYTANGVLDTSFAGTGKVAPMPNASLISSVKVQTDGKILAVAQVSAGVGDFNGEMSIVRLNADGSVDTSFGVSGFATISFGEQTDNGPQLAILPNGKIIGAQPLGFTATGQSGEAIGTARLNVDGSLDTSYGIGGIQTTGTTTRYPHESMALQADGKMDFAGQVYGEGFTVARLNADGSVDTSFGTNGKTSISVPSSVDGPTGIAIDGSGRILAVARRYYLGYTFVTARFTPSGAPDTTFGGVGWVSTDVSNYPNYNSYDAAVAVLPQTDGKVVVVGNATSDIGVVRYNVDGSIDSSLGVYRSTFGGADAHVNAAAWSNDGHLLVTGNRGTNGPADLAVAEYDLVSNNPMSTSPLGDGYRLVARDGGIFTYGNRAFEGSAGSLKLNQPIVGMASTPSGNGYWLVAADGGIFSYGDANFFGSTGAITLNQPIVGMTPTPSGNGYWLVARDGGIFAYGDAAFYGSTGSIHLNQPIVGMASTPSGRGYWLVASDGGVFAYGDAKFLGSTGANKLNQPIVGMASSPSGNGYWMVASDGGIFAYGDAGFKGSTGGTKLNQPIVSMTTTSTGGGYWLVARDGGVFNYGDATFSGSAGAEKLNQPIVGISR